MGKNVNKLPVKIDPCPIEEAIFEIRYSSEIPRDAIFGMMYGHIGHFFKNSPISLPILQIPEEIRRIDPSFKYQAYHQLKKDNYTLKIGPDVLTFSTQNPYVGWKDWSYFFFEILDNIFFKSNVIKKVERTGLRYINLFSHRIFDKIRCEVNINNRKLADESTNLRTEIVDKDFIKILQIGNSISMLKDNKRIECSVIDIDILYNVIDPQAFLKGYRQIVEKAHVREKELFFSLLNDSFLEKFNPDYGD